MIPIDSDVPPPPRSGPGRPRSRPVIPGPAPDQLRALQARLGLSAQGMALYLGIPLPTYRNWRDGHREPPAVASRLLEVLGLIETLAPEIHSYLTPGER